MLLSSRARRLILLPALLGWPALSSAQPVGTFRWQQEPYCNVLTLTATQSGGIFLLDGYDDECGDPRRASAVGIAFLNPDGSVGMGLTVVSVGGTPVHLDAVVSLATTNGIWRNNAGQSGAWTFTPGDSAGGLPRPVPRMLFPTGLSVAGATIANVGTPADPGDAAPKSYVDAANAVTLASARSLATASIALTAYSATFLGDVIHDSAGCMTMIPSATYAFLWIDLPVPIGGVIQAVRLKYVDDSAETLTLQVRAADFIEGATYPTDTLVQSLNSSNGETGRFHMATLTFVGLPPATSTRNYYLSLLAPPHSNLLGFCGAEVIYSMP